VISAVKEEIRLRRMKILIIDSENQRRLGAFTLKRSEFNSRILSASFRSGEIFRRIERGFNGLPGEKTESVLFDHTKPALQKWI
jgi:hypothetical protein